MERSHYDYREGQNREGSLPICANLTGVIERDLSVSVEFQAGTAKCKFKVHDVEMYMCMRGICSLANWTGTGSLWPGVAHRQVPLCMPSGSVGNSDAPWLQLSHSGMFLFLCLVFDPNTARDGDVDSDIPPIVFDAPIGPATKVCDPVCTACSNVRIRDDLIIEEKFENFSLSLSHSDQAVSLTSTAITVTIEDEDSE